jgi:hypothetical protein
MAFYLSNYNKKARIIIKELIFIIIIYLYIYYFIIISGDKVLFIK